MQTKNAVGFRHKLAREKSTEEKKNSVGTYKRRSSFNFRGTIYIYRKVHTRSRRKECLGMNDEDEVPNVFYFTANIPISQILV